MALTESGVHTRIPLSGAAAPVGAPALPESLAYTGVRTEVLGAGGLGAVLLALGAAPRRRHAGGRGSSVRRSVVTTVTGRRPSRSCAAARTAARCRRPPATTWVTALGLVLRLVPLWSLWHSDHVAGQAQEHAVVEMSARLEAAGSAEQPVAADAAEGPPPVAARPAYGESMGIVYVPRFGHDYARPLVEGAGPDVLDALGLGHYPSTAMPGEPGNFAFAGHRQSNGKALDMVDTLQPGDRIHVRTAEAYHTCSYRGSEVVAPEETRVLAPVPSDPSRAPTEGLLTLTTCSPRFGATERFVGQAVLTSWRPASAGAPAEISATAESAGRA